MNSVSKTLAEHSRLPEQQHRRADPLQPAAPTWRIFFSAFPTPARSPLATPTSTSGQSVYDAFFMDDWRVRPELTINAGIRWDYGAPLTELFGRLVNLDVAPPGFAAVAPVLGT